MQTNSLTSLTNGVFVNAQMNGFVQALVNGISPLTEFTRVQASNKDTEAVTAGILVPATSSVYQASAVAAYINCQAPNPAHGGTNAVAGYFSAYANGNNANVWALNPIMADAPGITGAILQNEFDFNVSNTSTAVTGILLTGASTATPATNSQAVAVSPLGTGHPWITGFLTADGAVSNNGLLLGAVSAANNSNSQSIQITSISSGGVHQAGTFQQLASGVLQISSTSGGITLAPNSASSPVIYNSFLQTPNANPAQSGQLRFASTDAIAFRNNANSGDVLLGKNSSDIFTFSNGIQTGQAILTAAAPAVSASQVGLGSTTATSATAGANGAVPAQVAGYLIINVAGTAMKIPYFNT